VSDAYAQFAPVSARSTACAGDFRTIPAVESARIVTPDLPSMEQGGTI
jgi:hypothetical protein